MVKRLSILMGCVLVFGHIQLEFGSWMAKLFPRTRAIFINPFIDSSYKFPVGKGVRLTWWITYCANDLLLILTYFAISVVLWNFSRKLAWIAIVYFGYHILDHFMLWYNYKTEYWLYVVENVCNVIAVGMLVFKREKNNILKSII